jgi:hypothetical protein
MQALRNKRHYLFQGALVVALGLAILAASAILQSCGPNDFNYGKVRNIIEGSPQRLDAEYVMLTAAQYQCGLQEDLWDTPLQPIGLPGQTATARVTQKGHDLKFSDDVSIGDKRYPYVQVRGDFSLFVNEITNDRAGPDDFTKFVETKVAVVIPHSCFTVPLPMMGVRKGQFTQDFSPVLEFHYNNGWSIDKIVHN